MPSLTDRVWSPYVAGVIIGLLQIPAFLLADTALGASSSFVTAVLTHEDSTFRIRATLSTLNRPPRSEVYAGADLFAVAEALAAGVAAGAVVCAALSDGPVPGWLVVEETAAAGAQRLAPPARQYRERSQPPARKGRSPASRP